jgi:glycosyltransferase involved in cell wall biosynthesis
MRSKNILFCAFACFPNAGSEPQTGWSWVTSLAERGHTVWVLTRRINKERIESSLAGTALTPANFLYVESPFGGLLRSLSIRVYYVVWQVCALFQAKRLLKNVHIDLIHHVTYGTIQLPPLLCIFGVPTVFGPCGGGQTTPTRMLSLLGSAAPIERLRTAIIKLLPFSPIHRILFRRTALVLVTNRDTLRLAQRMGCKRAEAMLDSGLPNDYCVPAAKGEGRFGPCVKLLWLGRDIPIKALSLAIEAVALAKSSVHLDILGPDDTDSVLERVRQAQAVDRISVHGRIPWDSVRSFYDRADCLLFSSLRDSFGSQLLEAAGNGLAIICLNHQGAAEFVTDTMGYRVDPTTPRQTARELAAAIDRYASLSPAERAKMSQASLQHARRFEYGKRAAVAEGFYDEIEESMRLRSSRHAET